MNEEPTFSLRELGEVKTVKVYNQAYVDKQQKRITELEAQIEKMKCCENCDNYQYTELDGTVVCHDICGYPPLKKWRLKEK